MKFYKHPPGTALWEVAAFISAMQTKDDGSMLVSDVNDAAVLASVCNIQLLPMSATAGVVQVNYDSAYRRVDTADSYFALLAKENGITAPNIKPPATSFIPTATGGIAIAPFAVRQDLDLPNAVWKGVVRHARSYGKQISVLVEAGERIDSAGLSEGELLPGLGVVGKINRLASAELVIGVPNVWTWLAAGMGKHIVYFYPEGVPAQRWWPWSDPMWGRILYSPHQIQVPAVLAGLRTLIGAL